METEQVLIRIDQYVKFIPLVTKGAIKVLREDMDGGEIFLYYLYPGQTCAFTLNCCLSEMPSQVKAIAEAGTEFLAVPRNAISRWLSEYPSWRQFILQMYSDRFNALLEAVDSIAFQQLDQRLLSYLTDKAIAGGNPKLNITHQQIADDLHSSREVISRLLKKLEKLEKIETGRNKIVVKL
ncbi:MAG: Crp/Fnr family transcriptional regulator [Owenweeksia sp.]|nr:Crp/Fnr family transcriptional regulator [Owenweeksia sp.]